MANCPFILRAVFIIFYFLEFGKTNLFENPECVGYDICELHLLIIFCVHLNSQLIAYACPENIIGVNVIKLTSHCCYNSFWNNFFFEEFYIVEGSWSKSNYILFELFKIAYQSCGLSTK